MEHVPMSPRHKQVLVCLSCLPNKILSIHGLSNATEFVLHELCQESCFNLKKAAYFVDNPDFDCLQGIAGFSKEEEYPHGSGCWKNPNEFTQHMRSCTFNNKVRDIQRASLHRAQHTPAALAQEIAPQLSFQDPYAVVTWPLKHDNRGVLIFERHNAHEDLDEHMINGLHLLAFCPIF